MQSVITVKLNAISHYCEVECNQSLLERGNNPNPVLKNRTRTQKAGFKEPKKIFFLQEPEQNRTQVNWELEQN